MSSGVKGHGRSGWRTGRAGRQRGGGRGECLSRVAGAVPPGRVEVPEVRVGAQKGASQHPEAGLRLPLRRLWVRLQRLDRDPVAAHAAVTGSNPGGPRRDQGPILDRPTGARPGPTASAGPRPEASPGPLAPRPDSVEARGRARPSSGRDPARVDELRVLNVEGVTRTKRTTVPSRGRVFGVATNRPLNVSKSTALDNHPFPNQAGPG
jgi:hypothetical protein